MSVTTFLDAHLLQQVRDHAGAHLEREVGGVLVGTIDDGTASVEAVLPALEAVGHRANVTFTHEVWEEVLTTVDEQFPGRRIVGWYHSHPGFGIFLSPYDEFIHQNFFSDAAMLALVVDPHTGAHGWFGWQDGSVVLFEEGSDPQHTTPPAGTSPSNAAAGRSHRGTAVLASLALATLTFAAGWLLATEADPGAPEQEPATATAGADSDVAAVEDALASVQDELAAAHGELEATEDELAAAQDESAAAQDEAAAAQDEAAAAREALDEAPVPPEDDPGRRSVSYRVRPGDTLWGIAASLLADGERWPEIADRNPKASPTGLVVGEPLEVPMAVEDTGQDAP